MSEGQTSGLISTVPAESISAMTVMVGGWVVFFFLMAGFSRRPKTHQPTKLLASLSGVYLWRRRRSYHHHQQQDQHKQTQQKGKKEERKQETRKAWIRANYHTNAPISRAIARNTHTLRRACVRTSLKYSKVAQLDTIPYYTLQSTYP